MFNYVMKNGEHIQKIMRNGKILWNKSEIPWGYTRCEYIEVNSSAQKTIPTGILPDMSRDTLEFAVYRISKTYCYPVYMGTWKSCLYGVYLDSRTSVTSETASLSVWGGTSEQSCSSGYNGLFIQNVLNKNAYKIVAAENYVKVNNTTYSWSVSAYNGGVSKTQELNIRFFSGTKVRIYDYIWKRGTTIMGKLLTCQNPSGTYGFYNTYNNTFIEI